jgi:hypothetical protein
MNLEAILPIIDDIVKSSLNDRVYEYGMNGNLTNRVASGKLMNSISSIQIDEGNGVTAIQVQAFGQPLSNTYAYWLINGRQPGKWANIGAIEQWIMNKKSFRIRDMKTGRFLEKNPKNVKNVAFVIARSLGKFGFKNEPQNFIEVSYDKIIKNKQILELIGDATYNDLIEIIEGI